MVATPLDINLHNFERRDITLQISRRLQRELLLIAFDLRDGEVDDLEAMCETLEAIAAEGRKELEKRKQSPRSVDVKP